MVFGALFYKSFVSIQDSKSTKGENMPLVEKNDAVPKKDNV